MTSLTMRVVRADFIVTGPDIEPMKFNLPDWFLCRLSHNQSSCAAGSRRRLPSDARCSW